MYISKYNKRFFVGDEIIVLYNTITSAIDVADRDILSESALIDLQKSKDTELLNYLTERGYLYPDQELESTHINKLYAGYQRYKKEIRPLIFYIVLTYNCNLSCSYCFQNASKKLNGTIDICQIPVIFNAIEQICKRFPESQTKPVIALFGGEPLLKQNENIIQAIFKEVASRGWVNGPIISNGVSLDTYLPLFKTYRPSGIQVTIDGPKEIHDARRCFANGKGTFDTIIKNINLAIDAGLKVGIRTNLDKTNIKFLSEIVALVENQGWLENKNVELSLSPVHDRACGSCNDIILHDSIFEHVIETMEILPQLSKWSLDGWSSLNHFRRLILGEKAFLPRFEHCEASVGKSFHMDGYGMFYSCIEACGMPEFAAGRYTPELEFFKLYDEMLSRNVLNMTGCSECGYTMVCGGGCGFQALLDGKDILSPSCANTDTTITRFIQHHYK